MTFRYLKVLMCLQTILMTSNAHAAETQGCRLLDHNVLTRMQTSAASSASERDGGIGGTGIYGEITSTSPLQVAGCTIEVAPGLKVTDDLAQMGSEQLKPGHFVNVMVALRNHQLVATSIVMQHLLEGPVTRKASGNRIEVMGRPVEITAGTRFAQTQPYNLSEGDYLKISGLRMPDGSIAASRIEKFSQITVAGVTGTLEKKGSKFSIGGIEVSGRPDTAQLGSEVLAIGKWTGNKLDVPRFILQSATGKQEKASWVLIEGSVLRADPKGLELAGKPKMSFFGGVPERLRQSVAGERVVILGERQPDGMIEVHDVWRN